MIWYLLLPPPLHHHRHPRRRTGRPPSLNKYGTVSDWFKQQCWPWGYCEEYSLTRCCPLMWTGPKPAFRRKTAGGVTVNPPRQTCNSHKCQHAWRQLPWHPAFRKADQLLDEANVKQDTIHNIPLSVKNESTLSSGCLAWRGHGRKDELPFTHAGQRGRLKWDQNSLYFLTLGVLSFHLNHVEFIFCVGVHTGLEGGKERFWKWI